MSENRPAIVVEHVVKRYGTHLAVDDLSFAIQPGEIFGILGPNGAGKTSTIEMMEGYRNPDSGSISVLGINPHRQPKALRQQIGVMLQDGGVSPAARVEALLRLYHAFSPTGLTVEQALEQSGLSEVRKQLVRKLSGGQRARLSLALAMMGTPRVLFLDEPTAGMDPHAREATLGLVKTIAESGVTVVLSTHLLDEAEQVCDRILIMNHGRQVALDSPRNLMAPERSTPDLLTNSFSNRYRCTLCSAGDPRACVQRNRPARISI
jgi:ABC-2 type transport system ATP-binding protein